MKTVDVVDADSHVMEVAETWDYLDEEFRDRRPIAVQAKGLPTMSQMDG
jgi:hypothetical protein